MSASGKPSLRFAVMCNGTFLKEWQFRCIQQVLELENTELVVLIENENTPSALPFFNKTLQRIFHFSFFRVYLRFWYKAKSIREVNTKAIFKNIPVLPCQPIIKNKHSHYFKEDDIKKITELRLDFILRFGFHIIRGEILNTSRYGIWSYHHGDEQKYRGGPPGFWETYYHDNVCGAILQRLTNKLDSGVILKKGYFKTMQHSYSANTDMLFFESARWPKQVCIDIQNDVAQYLHHNAIETNAPLYRFPNNFQALNFFFIQLKNKFLFHYIDLFCSEEWNVALVDRPIQTFLSDSLVPSDFKWLPSPEKGTYAADPFGFLLAEELHILYEKYSYRQQKGTISSVYYEKKSATFTDYSVVIEKYHHLSYPYTLEHDQNIYCIPESYETNEVSLYLLDKQSFKWEKKGTLVKDFSAIDSTLFFYEQKWWLLCTNKGNPSALSLSVFYSSQLEGPFYPHRNNPVKTDIRSSRCAGTPFYHENNLYRPSQDCSKTYGGAITLNKIIKLTSTEYKEESVRSLVPFDSKYKDGIHTLSSVGNYTLVDGKRIVFSADHFRRSWKRKMKKIFSRNIPKN